MRDKTALLAELLARLTDALEAAHAAHAAAIEGSTHPEARAENDKDTRGLEQSYLARGQARRVAELEAAVAGVAAMVPRELDAGAPIALGALVVVAEDDAQHHYLVAPSGGGSVLAGGVQVITPASPLGRALLGKHVGDVLEIQLAGRTRELEILALH